MVVWRQFESRVLMVLNKCLCFCYEWFSLAYAFHKNLFCKLKALPKSAYWSQNLKYLIELRYCMLMQSSMSLTCLSKICGIWWKDVFAEIILWSLNDLFVSYYLFNQYKRLLMKLGLLNHTGYWSWSANAYPVLHWAGEVGIRFDRAI